MASLLTSSFLADLVSLLEASSLGLKYKVNLFKGPKATFPAGAGPFVSILRAGGGGSEDTHNSTEVPAYETPEAQIVVRANDYEPAEVMANAVYLALWAIQNQKINGTWWQFLRPRQEPFDLPPDENNRARLAFNVGCSKRLSPATS